MARKSNLYSNFHFYVEIEKVGFERGLSLVRSTPEGLILGAAHAQGVNSLCQDMTRIIADARASFQLAPFRLHVWVLNHAKDAARFFSLIFKDLDPLPLDLDANAVGGVAMDRVLLTGVTYEMIRDVEREMWPAALQRAAAGNG